MIKYANQYIRSAASLIEQYDGTTPFAAFLKQYFKAHPKFGSKDRRYISQLCYTYFRIGKSICCELTEEKIKASFFLCETHAGEWADLFTDEWLAAWSDNLAAKWTFICSVFPGSDPTKLFAWNDELSKDVEAQLFSNAHLVQPDLFLRIRPGKEKMILQKLTDQQIPFQQLSENCLALPNGTKIDAALAVDKDVVVQDFSSQSVAAFFPSVSSSLTASKIWDCCAASGGKSLLAYDTIKNIRLTVSDLRPAILRNLKERFVQAGIKQYDSFVADIADPKFNIHSVNNGAPFKIVICDAPCSGSGTWGRTPEQLHFFSVEKIKEYASLQKKIVANVIPHIEKDGYLLYITCSVFKKENEEVVAFIQNNSAIQLIKMELLKGYDKKADSMFVALFKVA
ncbi:MAG: Fmu (Sun) domain-containing protein [Sediminibacterium sp.]